MNDPIPLCSLALYASESFVATVFEEVPTMKPMLGWHIRTRQDESYIAISYRLTPSFPCLIR